MSEENKGGNPKCKSPEHTKHLCYIISQGFHLSDRNEYESLITDPRFKCLHCGHIANGEENLCVPEKL
jgi:hypothetical protein